MTRKKILTLDGLNSLKESWERHDVYEPESFHVVLLETALAAMKLRDYVEHDNLCILSFWEAGEPTENGGYRIKYKGKWYEKSPIDKSPKCDCGLDDALDPFLGDEK